MTLYPYSYALLRAVPRVERGECINVGVVLYCQGADFLDACLHVEADRLRAVDPAADVELIRLAAQAVCTACHEPLGSQRHNDGLAHRFGMLTAPRSTVLQPSPVHTGLTADPARTLEHLLDRLVRI